MNKTLYTQIEDSIKNGITTKQFEKKFKIKLLKKNSFIDNQTERDYIMYFIDDNTVIETYKNKVTDIIEYI